MRVQYLVEIIADTETHCGALFHAEIARHMAGSKYDGAKSDSELLRCFNFDLPSLLIRIRCHEFSNAPLHVMSILVQGPAWLGSPFG